MIFFRKKKEEEKAKDINEIRRAIEEEKPKKKAVTETQREKSEKLVSEEKPVSEELKEVEKSSTFAPLFVKIEKYKSILEVLEELKATMKMIKNGLETQKEIEALADKNRKLIESCINKVNEKIISLDSEFRRPKGYREEKTPIRRTDELEYVLDDLKTQIEDLKSELGRIT